MSTHLKCCGVPMWLVKVNVGEVADLKAFECKVCDRKVEVAEPRKEMAK
ncbi:hypothetical protein [Rhodoplanes sp. Z2-YC6860]|nr:hypothetical protein [Rhodoplanes sp. Z2-YC6860]